MHAGSSEETQEVRRGGPGREGEGAQERGGDAFTNILLNIMFKHVSHHSRHHYLSKDHVFVCGNELEVPSGY